MFCGTYQQLVSHFYQLKRDKKNLCIDQWHTQSTKEPCPQNLVSTVSSVSHTPKLSKDELEPIYTSTQRKQISGMSPKLNQPRMFPVYIILQPFYNYTVYKCFCLFSYFLYYISMWTCVNRAYKVISPCPTPKYPKGVITWEPVTPSHNVIPLKSDILLKNIHV